MPRTLVAAPVRAVAAAAVLVDVAAAVAVVDRIRGSPDHFY